VRHVKIAVDKIHPNPHRDMKHNPVLPDRVELLVDSIDRTGFWDNIVVREHPDKDGAYQLAYGHTRLEAIKQSGIAEVTLPIAPLNDWDMYLAMRAENELQQTVSSAIAIENVRVGVGLMEKALKITGKNGTYEQFTEELTGRTVPAGTVLRDKHDGGFERVRAGWFKTGTIGRQFIEQVLQTKRLRRDTINVVIQSHYGEKIAKAKAKEAEAKAKEAEAKRKKAEAEKDAKEAKRLRAEAAKESAEAEALAAEARKISAGTVAEEVLLAFDSAWAMTCFATALKSVGVPADRHKEAVAHVKDKKVSAEGFAKALNTWWYVASGKAAADRKRLARDAAMAAFKKKTCGGNLDEYMLRLGEDVRDLIATVKMANTAARYYDDTRGRLARRKECVALVAELNVLIENLTGEAATLADEGNGDARRPAGLLTDRRKS